MSTAWLALTSLVCAGQVPAPPPETVIVTGTYEPLPLEESDRSVTVLPADAQRRILFNDPVELLRLDPSVDLQSRGSGNIQSDLSIRGARYGQTLVLWNGIRLNDAQTGHHDLDTPIPIDALDHIEILKGAGSTLYGSDAAGGVVNFVSRPPEGSEARLRTALGSFGTNQQSLEVNLAGRAWTEQLVAARDFSSGFRFDRDYRNLSLSSLTHYLGRAGSTDLILATSDRPFGADQFYGPYPSWERTRSWLAALRQTLGESTDIDASYRRHTDDFVLYRYEPGIYTNRHALETYTASARRRRRLGVNATLHYGGDGAYDSIASSSLGRHTRGRGAAFGALEFRALGRFSLNVGVREEVYRGLRHQFSPSISGGIWISPALRFRAAVSSAFRLPSFTDLYYHDPANYGSPWLEPERFWSYEAASEWRPARNLLAQLSVFERSDINGIDYARASALEPWRASNVRSAVTLGVEASVRADMGRAGSITLGYTGLRQRTSASGSLLLKYLSNTPNHNAMAGYEAVVGGKLAFRTNVAVVQRIGRDPYALWSLSAAMRAGAVRPFVRLSNLANTSYQEISGVHMPGRTILGGIEATVRFK